MLQNQEASSSLWSLSWHFYSVYSFQYRNSTCVNFWGFKWNLNRADISVPAVGQDIFHTENTIRKYFYSYWGSSPKLNERNKWVYFITKEWEVTRNFLLYQLFIGVHSEPKITEYFIVYSYLLHYIRFLKILRILPWIKILRFRYLHGGGYT